MRKPLVRFARRLASWEPQVTDDDLLETEFKTKNSGAPDLRPSVYEIAPGDVVRAFSEHATAFEPPRSAGGVDISSPGRTVLATNGDTGFAFTMEAHREIVLRDRADLLALVREVRGSLPKRTYTVTRAQVCDYVRDQLAAGNSEWVTARAQPTAKSWLSKL